MSSIQQFAQQILSSDKIQQEFINQGLSPVEIFALMNDLMLDLETNTEIQNLIIQKEAIQNRTNTIWELQQYINISQKEICDREGKLITIEEWNIECEYFNYPEYYVKGENREFYNNNKYFSNLMLDIINNTFGLVK